MLEFLKFYFKLLWRAVTFQANSGDFDRVDFKSVFLGLVLVWLAGMGRWWDDSNVGSLFQRLGVGSVLYALFLAFFVFIIGIPFRPRNWTYAKVLAFIGMAGPIAFIYAIPVERLFIEGTAIQLNVGFLILVATYRVCLLLAFFRTIGGLSWLASIVCTLLPICVIGALISFVGLADAIVNSMGGIRSHTPEQQIADVAFGIAASLCYALPLVVLVYGYLGFRAGKSDQ